MTRRPLLLLLALGACRPSVLAPPPGPVPAVADRPAGFACMQQVPTRADPDRLFAEAQHALRQLGLRPVRLDPVARRISIAGPTAPTGTGAPLLAAAHLYLDWQVTPADDSTDGSHTIHVAPGISNEPPTLTVEDRAALCRQAAALRDRFMARLPSVTTTTPACYRDAGA